MAVLNQLRVLWNGTSGGPGISTFYGSGTAQSLMTPLHAFFDGMKGRTPTDVTWTFPAAGTQIDDTTGQAVGAWTTGAAAPITGTGTGTYSLLSGTVVNWNTGTWVNGRQLRGKTFFVPLTSACYDADGRVDEITRAAIESLANTTFGGGSPLRVYSRTALTSAPVSTATVPAKAVYLSSRRD